MSFSIVVLLLITLALAAYLLVVMVKPEWF
ncbi:MAG: potassium-transporting ATPase subunit F [Anaerolineae bacterium]|nr:potassium-transporting ATPase subunit F [Gloeobacterales cyanobacterium ES-bin-313]